MKFDHWQHFYRARFFVLIKQDAKAIKAFKMALVAKPDFGLAASCLGHLYASMGQMHLAELSFLDALRINPNDSVTHFNLGFSYEKQKHFDKAISSFKSAIAIDAKNDRAWYGMGWPTRR